MRMATRSGGVLLAALLVVGCSSSPLVPADAAAGRPGADASVGSDSGPGYGGSDGSCGTPVPPMPPAVGDAGATSEQAIEAQWLGLLDRLFGQFLRGDILVYRGTMEGHATSPTTPGYDPRPDSVIAEGPALASLVFRPGAANDWAPIAPAPFVEGQQAILDVHSLVNDQYMVFGQPQSDPTMTATSGIEGGRTTNALMATCTGCAPSLWDSPSVISFNLTAAGTITTTWYGADGTTSVDQAVSTSASVQLTRTPPCNLTFQDLATLNESTGPVESPAVFFSSFVLSGGEWIWHTTGSATPELPSMHGACDGQQFQYSIDLYVNAANLADYGVRNYVQGPTQSVCAI